MIRLDNICLCGGKSESIQVGPLLVPVCKDCRALSIKGLGK